MVLASTALTMLLGSLIILLLVAGRRPLLAGPAWLGAIRSLAVRLPAARPVAVAGAEISDAIVLVDNGTGERRTVRYRMARVTDRPQEVHATELGRLSAGDVVALVQEHGAYYRIRTEAGLDGWIPKIALEGPGPAAT